MMNPTIKVKYICKCLDSKRIPLSATKRKKIQGGIPYWGANGVVDYVDDYLFDEELVLLGEDGAPFFDKKKQIGFCVNEKVWINNHIHVLKAENFHSIFLMYSLNSVDYRPFIEGTTRDKLTQDKMKNILVPNYPLETQKQIADFLDKETTRIDTLISRKQKQIELLKEKRQVIITHAVTKGLDPNVKMKDSGVEWIGEIPESWDAVRFRYICKSINDGTHFSPESYSVGDYLYITAKNIKEYGVDLSNVSYITTFDHKEIYRRCPVKKGDVLYIKDGATAGIATVNALDDEFSLLSSVALIKPKIGILDSYFTSFQLNESNFKRYYLKSLVGGAMTRFTVDIITRFYLLVPPSEKQIEISSHLRIETYKIDNIVLKIQKSITLLKEFRSSLITHAVSGQIDLTEGHAYAL